MEESTMTVANENDSVEVLGQSGQTTVVAVKRKRVSKKEVTPENVSVGLVSDTNEAETKGFDIVSSFNANHIKVLESAIALNTPALLVGHTGLGKTTLVKELANRNKKELIRLSVHSGITADEILGKWLAESGSTVWQDGLLIQAMKSGSWIVFDEINACPADVMFALHSLLDDDRHVTLLEKKGEIVRPHADFRFFATMNPQEDYAGTKEMNMAFLSRFNAVIEIEPYAEAVEVAILMSKGISKKVAEQLVTNASKLRDFKSKDEIMYFCGTRDLISTAKLVESGLDFAEAIKYGIINKMSPDDRLAVGNKIPDFKYKTQAQKELERISNENSILRQNVTVSDAKVNAMQKLVNDLENEVKQLKTNGGSGNANLDENTKRALQILKVLK